MKMKKRKEKDEVKIFVEFRDEQRSINYHSLFSFLPMMPFHRALYHNSWDQLFWTFKAYPNIIMLAQNYPRMFYFAQKVIMNGDASADFNKVLSVPITWFVNHSHSPYSYCFHDKITEQGNESLNDLEESSPVIKS